MSGIFANPRPWGLPGQTLRHSHPPSLLAAWLLASPQRAPSLVEDRAELQRIGDMR